MLLLFLMVQDFCQLMTCLVLMRYQIQFIGQRNILIKPDDMQHQKISIKKEKSAWTCLACHKRNSKEKSSVICERCLRWCHLSCTNLKRQELKSRKWFCKLCTIKFTQKSFCSERLYTLTDQRFLCKVYTCESPLHNIRITLH